MSWKQYLLVGIGGMAAIAFLAYEAYALFNKPAGDTISEYVWAAAYKHPLIPLLIGLVTGGLFGHFFWQRVP